MPFKMNRVIITLKFFSDEYLFHTISNDKEMSTKIIVQAKTIIEPGGVHAGRFIVWYHTLPVLAK